MFLLLCQYFKSTAQERLKDGKKSGAKKLNGVKTVQKTVRKIITVQRTFKIQCNNVKLQESKHQLGLVHNSHAIYLNNLNGPYSLEHVSSSC